MDGGGCAIINGICVWTPCEKERNKMNERKRPLWLFFTYLRQ